MGNSYEVYQRRFGNCKHIMRITKNENCKLRGFSSHDFRLPSAANAPIDFALEPGNGCQNDVTNSSQIIMDV